MTNTISGFSEEKLVESFLECEAIQWRSTSYNRQRLEETVVVDTKMLCEKSFEEAELLLDLKLCYFGNDDTWGLHSRKSGEVAFINGHTYFSSLEALLKCILDTGRIVIYDEESVSAPKILINNIFQGCTSLEEIRLKLTICNGLKGMSLKS